ncbi:MAG: hypothetical protein EON56_01285 [Alphaproteobacteria bacterium]|nr:MAG: hypothetical protein EON56_01285 [Alphaproteobacteria bacterium]
MAGQHPGKAKHELSLKQQIDYIRRFGEAWPLRGVAVVCALVMIAGFCAFLVSSQESVKVLLLFVSGVSGLLALAIGTQVSGLQRAARATRTGRRVRGVINLVVDRSDSENVLITGEMQEGSAVWTLHFGRPFGWTPQTGAWPCEMVLISDEPVPALVLMEHGLLLPTRKSQKNLGRRS